MGYPLIDVVAVVFDETVGLPDTVVPVMLGLLYE